MQMDAMMIYFQLALLARAPHRLLVVVVLQFIYGGGRKGGNEEEGEKGMSRVQQSTP